MRLFCKNVIAFFFLQLVILASILSFYQRETDSFVASALDKHKLARTMPAPRLILVGGSATAFGTVSPLLQQLVGRNVVNLGGHAGQGFDYRISEARACVRPGDIVVLSFEYETLVSVRGGSALTLLRTVEAAPECLRYFSGRNFKEIANNGHLFLRHILRRTWLRLRNGRWPKNKPPYSRGSFNHWGDVVAHYKMRPEGLRGKVIHLRRLQRNLDRSIREMNRFSDWCRRKKIRIYYFFPVIPQSSWAVESTRKNMQWIFEEFQRKLQMPLLNRPVDVVFQDGAFFDTPYHLVEAAARKRTLILARALCRFGSKHHSSGVGSGY